METPPEVDPERKSGMMLPVTRGQLAIIIAVIFAIYAVITSRDEARINSLEQRDRARAQEYGRLQGGVDKLDNDFQMLLQQIIIAKKVDAP